MIYEDLSFWNNVFARNMVQDMNLNKLKLKVIDTYKKNEKETTKFEHCSDENVVIKAYLEEKLTK